MDIRICQKKCELKNNCPEYIAHLRILTQSENIPSYSESQSIAMASN